MWGWKNMIPIQKRVNIAGLRLLSLERPSYKCGPCLASGDLALELLPN